MMRWTLSSETLCETLVPAEPLAGKSTDNSTSLMEKTSDLSLVISLMTRDYVLRLNLPQFSMSVNLISA